jgi:hypothetical protein
MNWQSVARLLQAWMMIPAAFEFSAPAYPNFLLFLQVRPLYTLLTVQKQNRLPTA